MNVRISSKENQSLAQENAALRNEVNILKEQLALLGTQKKYRAIFAVDAGKRLIGQW